MDSWIWACSGLQSVYYVYVTVIIITSDLTNLVNYYLVFPLFLLLLLLFLLLLLLLLCGAAADESDDDDDEDDDVVCHICLYTELNI